MKVKVWGYDDGQCYKVGYGHAGPINKVNELANWQIAISPNQKYIISVGSEGAVIVWKTPEDVIQAVKEFSAKLNEELANQNL